MAVVEHASRPATIEPESFASVDIGSARAQAIRILLVEPDLTDRAELGAQLWRRGFAVQGFDDGYALLATPTALEQADVIVAGWGTSKMSGQELTGRLRHQGIDVPVVLLSGRVLQGRECVAFDPDAQKFTAETRGVEALAAHLREVVSAFATRVRA